MTTNIRKLFKRYRKNTSGNFATIWAVSIGAVVFTVGAAYDVNQVSKAKQIAQIAADNMALTASIAVDTENENRYVDGQEYPYQELGGPVVDFTDSMRGSVEYDVDDDGDGEGNLLARATIIGEYQTAFMAAFGVDSISFEAKSDVAYAQTATTPASVLLVLDNSGSMAWDDDEGVNKIDGLKSTVSTFMDTLEELTSNTSPRVLRTGMLSYSSRNQYITDYDDCEWVYYGWWWGWRQECSSVRVTDNDSIFFNNKVTMGWRTVPASNIDAMYAKGGTDPFGALKKAKNWMQNESSKHYNENGESEPLKFLIFMTDGANNSSSITNRSLDKCNVLKSSGTIIYTVGYDLEAGYQYQDGQYTGYYVSSSDVTKAQNFLSSCASDSDHYILADDADDLEQVFEQIGQEIVNEVIRIKH